MLDILAQLGGVTTAAAVLYVVLSFMDGLFKKLAQALILCFGFCGLIYFIGWTVLTLYEQAKVLF